MKVEIMNLRASAAVPYQVLPITQKPPSLTHYSTVLAQQRYISTEDLLLLATAKS